MAAAAATTDTTKSQPQSRKRLVSARVLSLDEADTKILAASERETKKAKTIPNRALKVQARAEQEVAIQNTKRDTIVAQAGEVRQRRQVAS